MATKCWSSMQNINNWRFWTWKNKYITESNKSLTICWYNYLCAKDQYAAKYQLLINKWHLMIRLEMKNCNTTLTAKQQTYQHYNQIKLINTNILQVRKYYLLIKVDWQSKLSLSKPQNSGHLLLFGKSSITPYSEKSSRKRTKFRFL